MSLGRNVELDYNNQRQYDLTCQSGNSSNFATEALKGIHEPSQVANVFFSKRNIDYLQDKMREGVARLSQNTYIISRQSDDSLKVIMRTIFLQFATNKPFDIATQLYELNATVLDYCVPRILNEVVSYIEYRRMISEPRDILSRGMNTSVKGTKQQEGFGNYNM